MNLKKLNKNYLNPSEIDKQLIKYRRFQTETTNLNDVTSMNLVSMNDFGANKNSFVDKISPKKKTK